MYSIMMPISKRWQIKLRVASQIVKRDPLATAKPRKKTKTITTKVMSPITTMKQRRVEDRASRRILPRESW